MDDQIQQLEVQLDLKDYYDIKRPTVAYFNYQNKQLKVTRIDLLSDVVDHSLVKVVNPPSTQGNHLLNLVVCKAITHPSNNSIFIVD